MVSVNSGLKMELMLLRACQFLLPAVSSGALEP